MSKKLKIFVDAEVLVHPHFSGIGHYTLELLRALDNIVDGRPDVQITLGAHYKEIPRLKSYGFRNFKYRKSPFSIRINNALKIRDITFYYDLLFGKKIYLFPNFTTWPLLFSKCVPIIYDLSYERFPQYADPMNQKFLSENVKRAADRADRILTISEYSKKEIKTYYKPKKKIDVLYPGIDQTQFFRWPEKEIARVKAAYGIHGKYIMYIGNLEPRKNLVALLKAYENLPSEIRKEYSLLLVGLTGWKSEGIFKTIERLRMDGNHIQLPAAYVQDHDRAAIISGASLLVYPSKYEGFGIPPVEAMACGVPVISSNNSSLPEAVGKAAKKVAANNSNQLSETMKLVLTDKTLQQEMRKEGFKQADKFSWHESAKKLLAVMDELHEK